MPKVSPKETTKKPANQQRIQQLVHAMRTKGAPEYEAIAEILLAVTGVKESTSPAQDIPS